ncbi:MAG: hypothetical protein ACR2L4_09590 [Actinomycetota bacterium]
MGKRTARSRTIVERSMTATIDREPKDLREESGRQTDRERALALGLVIAIGVVSLVVQFLFIPRDWPTSWDEAVYLSQVTPDMDGLFFNAWHARGITLLVAPVTWLGGSVSDVRLFLMVLSAITITLTFRLWIPVIGIAAALAAFIFSFSWQGLIPASEIKPNYWGALLGLATAGLIARRLEDDRTGDLVLASIALAAMALVRPTEATVLAGAVGAYILLFRRMSWRDLFPLGIGLFLGWLPWIIEMSVRFGGLPGAVRAAGKEHHFGLVPVAENVLLHLRYTDGKYGETAIPGAIWWGVLVVMVAVAIARGVTRVDRAAAMLCAFGALALAAEYLFFVPALTYRFLLPAYAMASIPFAIGLVSLLRGTTARRVIGAIVVLLMIPWTIWQGAVTAEQAPKVNRGAAGPARVGTTIRRLAEGRPCLVLSQRAYPQVAYAAGCSGGPAKFRLLTAERLENLSRSGRAVFVVRIREVPEDSALGSIEPVPALAAFSSWYVYEIPPTLE